MHPDDLVGGAEVSVGARPYIFAQQLAELKSFELSFFPES